MMGTTAAKVSTLFTTVGQSYKPFTAGNGGLMRGLPLLPSNDSSKAVSSPQTKAPAPSLIFILNEHKKEWKRIEELLHYNLCVLGFFKK